MSTTVTPDFERLCDQDFGLAARAAYDGLDDEIVEIKAQQAARGLYLSSATGILVMRAILVRFKNIVDAFDEIYLAKWRDDPLSGIFEACVPKAAPATSEACH